MLNGFMEQLNKNPKGVATVGLVGVIAFGMLGWMFPMYICLALGLIGYIKWKIFPSRPEPKSTPIVKKNGLVRHDAPEILVRGKYTYKRISSFTNKRQAEQFKGKTSNSFLIECDNPKRFGQGVKHHVYRRVNR